MASRIAFLEQCVRPALSAGQWVISDRLDLSTIFYQTVMMKHTLIERYGFTADTSKQILAFHKKANEISRAGLEEIPLRYIVLDADDRTLNARRPVSATDRFESQDKGFQRDIRSFYRQYAGANKHNPNVRKVFSDTPLSETDLDALVDWIVEDTVVPLIQLTA
jgi:thymidylate kinase